LVPNDLYYAPSRQWLDQPVADGSQIIVPTLVIPELGGAIVRRTGDPAAAARGVLWVRRLSSLWLVAIDDSLGDEATDVAMKLRLRGADAVYVALARREGVPLVTWDREQLDRTHGIIVAHTPETAP